MVIEVMAVNGYVNHVIKNFIINPAEYYPCGAFFELLGTTLIGARRKVGF